MISHQYFREYRNSLGFSRQEDAKKFFGAKDIAPGVDLEYIKLLNERLCTIVDKLDSVVAEEIKGEDIESFKQEYIHKPFKLLRQNDVLRALNNQGRRPEQVYFSWMRGYVATNYFSKALSMVFEVDAESITQIGDDDLAKIDTFKRTPKADLEIDMGGKEALRIEVQSGFTGINDIKQHKVLEAKRVFNDSGINSLAVHFDLYNGQAAFIKLHDIEDTSVNWITRQQMEGQTVFNIDQNCFVWKITEAPIKYREIKFESMFI